MAITTLSGATGSDLTTLVGTELADTFPALQENALFIDGKEGDDTVSAATALENVTLDLGSDNDTITFTAEVLTSKVTLGIGNDKINIEDFTGSIYGGSGQDSIIAASDRTITNSLIRGDGGKDDFDFTAITGTIVNTNSDDDDVTVTSTTTSSEVYGGRQRDTILLSGKTTSSLIRGDANEDKITLDGELSGVTVNGNAANDQIITSHATVANSSIYGGKGDDNLDIGGGAIYISGGKGADDIDLTSNAKHTIYGGAGDDAINSDSTKVLFIDSGADDDTVTLTGVAADSGIHSVDGGAGDDIFVGTTGKELFDGGTEDDGADTFTSTGGDDTMYGRAGADRFVIDAASDAVSGHVLAQGGAGDDIFELDLLGQTTFQDTIKGEDGTDTIVPTVVESIDFTAANSQQLRAFDSITSVENLTFGTADSAYAMAADVAITLSSKIQTAGIVKIDASLVTADSNKDLTINASEYSSATALTFIGPVETAGDANVIFVGGKGNDTFTGSFANEDAPDIMTGGDGNDTFNVISASVGGGTKSDTVITDFGNGADVLTVSSAATSEVSATVVSDYTATSSTINNLSTAGVVLTAQSGVDVNMSAAGGAFGYHVVSGTAASTLQGSSNNDSLVGSSFADSLVGNNGNDTVKGGGGNDVIKVGAGDDEIQFVTGQAVDGMTVEGSTGTDKFVLDLNSAVFAATFDLDDISGIETIETLNTAGTANASLTFAAVTTNTTTETINVDGSSMGSDESLLITNSAATDKKLFNITGGAGADSLIGSNGIDTITGGTGGDTMTGGSGADIFGSSSNFGTATTSIVSSARSLTGTIAVADFITFATTAADNVDRITSFTSGTEKLDVPNAATAPTNIVGLANDVVFTANETYVAYGSYTVGTGKFIINAFNATNNHDALVVTGNGILTVANHTGYTVLEGLNQALVAADFV